MLSMTTQALPGGQSIIVSLIPSSFSSNAFITGTPETSPVLRQPVRTVTSSDLPVSTTPISLGFSVIAFCGHNIIQPPHE